MPRLKPLPNEERETGKRLRLTREKLPATQTGFACRVGITNYQLYNYEKGRAPLPLMTGLKICDIYKIDQFWLAFGTKYQIGSYDPLYNVFAEELYSSHPELTFFECFSHKELLSTASVLLNITQGRDGEWMENPHMWGEVQEDNLVEELESDPVRTLIAEASKLSKEAIELLETEGTGERLFEHHLKLLRFVSSKISQLLPDDVDKATIINEVVLSTALGPMDAAIKKIRSMESQLRSKQ